jgi:CRISPR-associated endonuclease Csn1
MKVLGLDIGVSSIGWALIEETGKERKILGMGSRIIPLSIDDKDEFSSGNKISKNQKRTTRRTQRKGYDRYQLRRSNLKERLSKANMLPDEDLIKLPALELWRLRSKGISERISLQELGRILLHLNQKRGYKSSRSDANLDKKDTEYVAEVKNRHQLLSDSNQTIGQHFYYELQKNPYYKIKQQVYPREAYIEEFEALCKEQSKHWPIVLTAEFVKTLRDEIIYYQRKLKSQKGLVSVCEFEGFRVKKIENGKQKEYFVGPKVAPRSSPIFQIAKIWETINSISLKNKKNETYIIPLEKKNELFNYLDSNERLSESELFKILEIKKSDGWYGNKQTSKGLQGNLTKAELLKYLDKDSPLVQFEIDIQTLDSETYLVDRKTGEVLESKPKKIASRDIENEPLYKLWHTIYSIADQTECANALQKNFGLDTDTTINLAGIDFTKSSFGNKSVKSIRKLLPYLMEGCAYSNAASFAGYNHSHSLTKAESLKRKLAKSISALPKNSLRQPVVEKILNHVINVVNSIIDENQGWITKEERERNQLEIRIELARELKQSQEERNETFSSLSQRERENDIIRKRIESEYKNLGVRATRNNVIKWRLFHEISNDGSKLNAVCIYCGQPFGITDALHGNNIDIEHIIPKSLLFDDSQSNKTLTHRRCNEDKGNRTAFDFMSSKDEDKLNEYIERVDRLYKTKIIGKGKRNKLLMPADKIPQDFISRQLGETRYITRKAKEILEQVSYNVWSTSGNVTAYLRDKWGWNDVIMNLQLSKYRELNLTEWREWETNDGQKHKKEVIKGWSKRDDHRHHAIDALAIACTQQGFIQRLNTLNSQHTRDEMRAELKEYKEKLSLLDNFIVSQRPFSTQQIEKAVDNILISFKSGKKVASLGKRKIKKGRKKVVVQSGIVVPRGALSEESVYGKIKTIEKEKPIKYLFENPHLIFKPYIKTLVEERLAKHGGDVKKTLANLKKEPIYLDEAKTKILEYGTSYKEETVIKYPVEVIKTSDIPYIVDKRVAEIIKARLEQYNNKEKEAFKDLENNPVWFNEEKKIPIKTVRMLTGLSSVEPVKKDENGKDIGFVKPGNNHHLAFYIDENGGKQVQPCTFWHGVERKKYEIPVVIKKPKETWDKILNDKNKYPQSFLEKLPNDKWIFIESLQQNEMFILGLEKDEVDKAIQTKDYQHLNKHLYRVQKLSMKGNGQIDLWFRHHLETELNDSNEAKTSKRFYNLQSIGAFEKLNPIKIRIDNLGKIKL